MNRREARKNAFYLVFQIDFHQQEEFDETKTLFFEQKEEVVEQNEKEFILQQYCKRKKTIIKINYGEKKQTKWDLVFFYAEGKDGFGIYRDEAGNLYVRDGEKIADTLTDFLVKGTGIDIALTLWRNYLLQGKGALYWITQ